MWLQALPECIVKAHADQIAGGLLPQVAARAAGLAVNGCVRTALMDHVAPRPSGWGMPRFLIKVWIISQPHLPAFVKTKRYGNSITINAEGTGLNFEHACCPPAVIL